MDMLKVFTVDQNEQWDATVCSFKEYDVYWLSGYVKAFELHGDGEATLFYYEDEETRGINVVMKRDVAKDAHFKGKLPEGQFFDFATPYGYGGWVIEGDGNEANLQAALLHIMSHPEEIRRIKNDELAWKKVQAYYDWHNISLQTQDLYHKAI